MQDESVCHSALFSSNAIVSCLSIFYVCVPDAKACNSTFDKLIVGKFCRMKLFFCKWSNHRDTFPYFSLPADESVLCEITFETAISQTISYKLIHKLPLCCRWNRKERHRRASNCVPPNRIAAAGSRWALAAGLRMLFSNWRLVQRIIQHNQTTGQLSTALHNHCWRTYPVCFLDPAPQ